MNTPLDQPTEAVWNALFHSTSSASVGPDAREGTLNPDRIQQGVSSNPIVADLPQLNRRLVQGLAFLWHDHLDESHEISQGIHGADGSLLHAMMHRREPDYWNSKYWFRQAGPHVSHQLLLDRALKHFPPQSNPWILQLQKGEHWDPLAFVDLCETTASRRQNEFDSQLRAVQRLEFQAFLHFLLRSEAGNR